MKGRKSADTPACQRIHSDASPKFPACESGQTRFGRMFKQEIRKMQSGWSALETHVVSKQSVDETVTSEVKSGDTNIHELQI